MMNDRTVLRVWRNRCRFVHDVPLHESHADVRANVIAYLASGDTKVHHFSGVTDLRVHQRHVFHLMRGGRARWKIAHETFHTLKNQGDHFEHNDGHGTPHRSVVCAMLMMLAFLVDQTQQRCCALFQTVWATLGSTRMWWERMRALFDDDAFTSMRQRFEALVDGVKKSSPIVTIHASSSPCISPATACQRPRSPPTSGGSYASMTR